MVRPSPWELAIESVEEALGRILERRGERAARERLDGHQEGDRLLQAFPAALADTVRENDAVGRLGGDEFAALLLQADEGSVDAFLGRLPAHLSATISVSSGAAYSSEVSGPHEQLFELADRRLYATKMARAA